MRHVWSRKTPRDGVDGRRFAEEVAEGGNVSAGRVDPLDGLIELARVAEQDCCHSQMPECSTGFGVGVRRGGRVRLEPPPDGTVARRVLRNPEARRVFAAAPSERQMHPARVQCSAPAPAGPSTEEAAAAPRPSAQRASFVSSTS